MAISGPAEAKKTKGMKDISFSATAVGGLPTLTYKYHSGQWKLAKNSAQPSVKFHLKATKRKAHRIVGYKIDNYSVSPRYKVTKVENFSAKKVDKVIMHKVKNEELQAFVAMGKQQCEKEGHPDKLLKKLVKPGISYVATIWSKTAKGMYSSQAQLADNIGLQIICEPQEFKVEKIKLTMKYDKQPGKCHYKVTLRAEFQTNSASNQKFDFWLYRKDGNTQKNSATAGPTGKAVFTKKYTIKDPVNRQYMVAWKNTTSKWTPMKINCSSSNSSGFQN